MPDEVRAGGRIPLIIGRGLTANARKALGLKETDIFIKATPEIVSSKGYTLGAKNGWPRLWLA